MATLDATVGGPAANTYELLAAAEVYFDGRIGSAAWSDVTDDAGKTRALITATQQIDAFPLRGKRASAEQALQWPRVDTWLAGVPLESSSIPEFVKRAEYEQAFALYIASKQGTLDPFAATGLEQFKRLSVGDIDLEMRDPQNENGLAVADDPRAVLAPAAYRLLAAYFLPVTSDTGPTVRTFRHARG